MCDRNSLSRMSIVAAAALGFCTNAYAQDSQDLYDDTVYRTFELVFDNATWESDLVATHQSDPPVYVQADLVVYDSPTDTTGTVFPDVGVQYKGGTSYLWGSKRPFKITVDAFVEDQEVYGFDKITLNNGVLDPTKVREAIAYKIMNEFMPSPRANLIFLRAGTAGAMEDIGVYTSVERVNKRFMRKHFPNDDGHRYRGSGIANLYCPSNMTPLQCAQDDYDVSIGDPLTEYEDLADAIEALNATPHDLSDIEDVFSVDQACWQVAMAVLVKNSDDIRNGNNFYIYQDTHNDRMHILPWDWDGSMTEIPVPDDIFHAFTGNKPVTDELIFDTPQIRDRYLAHLRELVTRLDWAAIESDVIRHRAWTDSRISTAREVTNHTHAEYLASHDALETFILDRRAYLDTVPAELLRPAPIISSVTHSPAVPVHTDTVWVNATVVEESSEGISAVTLYSRDRGAYQRTAMFDDGLHNDGAAGDGVYGAAVPAYPINETIEYYIEASSTDISSTSTGAKRYEPVYAEHKPYSYSVFYDSPIRINEFMADNDSTIEDPDEAGEFPDWIELHNTGTSSVDLSGYFLTDDLEDRTQFAIPSGVSIPAGGYLLFWADDDTSQGPTHTNFKLGASGEEVGLFSPTSTGNGLVDSHVFGDQLEDVSSGQECDNEDEWERFFAPSPGTTNGSRADLNGDGVLDFFDVSDFLNAHSNMEPMGDFNNDGDFDFFDVSEFINAHNAGC